MLFPGCDCCGGASFPCSCDCTCTVDVSVEGQEVLLDTYSGSNPHPECDYFTGVFRICVVDNTDAASLADGYDKVLVTAYYTQFDCNGTLEQPWTLQLYRSVNGYNSSICDLRNCELKTETFTWNCGEDGCPQGSPVLLNTDVTQAETQPQSWLDNPCYANLPAITLDCNPLP